MNKSSSAIVQSDGGRWARMIEARTLALNKRGMAVSPGRAGKLVVIPATEDITARQNAELMVKNFVVCMRGNGSKSLPHLLKFAIQCNWASTFTVHAVVEEKQPLIGDTSRGRAFYCAMRAGFFAMVACLTFGFSVSTLRLPSFLIKL